MRIIGGSLGGRRLRAPKGAGTRPTADRVREAIFNILGPPPTGCRVLDLCAGAGTLAIEALSRGAEEAVLVDRAADAVRCLEQNLRDLGLEQSSRVHRREARSALRQLSGEFDWVFLDPPYAGSLAGDLLTALGAGDRLAADARVIVEHDRRNEPASMYGCLVRTDHRRYGDTGVSFYRRRPATTRPSP